MTSLTIWSSPSYDPTGGSSTNHIMYGGWQSFAYETLVGVSLGNSNGWQQPPSSGLAGAAFEIETHRGPLAVQWTRGNAAAFALSARLSAGTQAEVCVPLLGRALSAVTILDGAPPAASAVVWAAGKPGKKNMAGIVAASANASIGTVCFHCGEGTYDFF